MIIEQDATIDQKTACTVSIAKGTTSRTYRFVDLEGLPRRHVVFKMFSLVGVLDQDLMLDLLDTILDVLGLKVLLFIVVDIFNL
jgi:hypothetical protein